MLRGIATLGMSRKIRCRIESYIQTPSVPRVLYSISYELRYFSHSHFPFHNLSRHILWLSQRDVLCSVFSTEHYCHNSSLQTGHFHIFVDPGWIIVNNGQTLFFIASSSGISIGSSIVAFFLLLSCNYE